MCHIIIFYRTRCLSSSCGWSVLVNYVIIGREKKSRNLLTCLRAARLPRASMACAACRVSRRVCSIIRRHSAIQWATTSCTKEGRKPGVIHRSGRQMSPLSRVRRLFLLSSHFLQETAAIFAFMILCCFKCVCTLKRMRHHV